MFTAAHPEWPEFENRMNERIERHRRELEDPNLDLAGSNFIRGRIAAIREILENATPPEPVIAPSVSYSA